MEANTLDLAGNRLRADGEKIATEVTNLTEKFGPLGMKIKYYNSEYRLPFVIAQYEDGSRRAWLTMTLPPYKSTKSFILRGEIAVNSTYSSDINFVEMMETNFDTIWEYCSVPCDCFTQFEN